MTVEQLNPIIANMDYGDVWSEDKLVSVFEIELPDLSGDAKSILRNAKKYDLAKMSAYCMINEQLLNHGKCFIQDGDIYRVPLISEVTNYISKYYNSSNRKFKKAEKLRKSFSRQNPVEAKEVNNRVNRTMSMRTIESKSYTPMV